MQSFSQEQVEEIDKYLESISWYYNSEEELINLLNETKTQLINVGLPTLDFVKKDLIKVGGSFELREEMKRKANQLYLKQLDPICRFPMD